jgi:nucleoside-diphosphate-sugar epimerase
MRSASYKRIVVLGGAGFVGSALVRRLVLDGHAVSVVDNFFHGSPQHLADIPGLASTTELDALDYPRLLDYMAKASPDVVVNCIGDTFIPSAYDHPDRFLDLNIRATLNVLRASAAARVKQLLHLSTTEVYGENAANSCTESAALAPENTYAVSKLAADRLCYTFSLEHGLQTIIARLFNAYGPRETHPYIVPEIIAQLSVGDELTLGNLDAARDLTYVEDTAAALSAMLWIPVQRAEVFNVGSGDVVSVRDLAQMLGTLMGHESVTFNVAERRLRRRDLNRLCCDPTKLRKRTGWMPRVGLRRGLEMTIEWFKKNGERWLWQDRLRDSGGQQDPRLRLLPTSGSQRD